MEGQGQGQGQGQGSYADPVPPPLSPPVVGTDIQAVLVRFLSVLLSMGEEMPVYLFTLTHIVQPALSESQRTLVLGQMFKELSGFLEATSEQSLRLLVQSPPLEALALRLLLDLYQVHLILQGLTTGQLFLLAANMPANSEPHHQLHFLSLLQTRFRVWTPDFLTQLHHHFRDIPLHLEREALLAIDQSVPLPLASLVVLLIRQEISALLAFKNWIASLPESHLVILVNLLCINTQILVDIKTRLNPTHISLPTPKAGDKRTRDGLGKGEVPSDLLAEQLDGMTFVPRKAMKGLDSTTPSTQQEQLQSQSGQDQLRIHQESSRRETISYQDPFLGDFDFSVDDFSSFLDDSELNMSIMDSNPQDFELSLPDSTFSSYERNTYNSDNDNNQHTSNINTNAKNENHTTNRDIDDIPVLLTPHHAPPTPVPYPTYPIPAPSPLPLPSSPAPYSVPTSPSPAPYTITSPAPSSTLPHLPQNPSASVENRYALKIQKQPPAQTVYQRILKPFPSVLVIGDSTTMANLFVATTLTREDSQQELPHCLDGTLVVKVGSGQFATFSKLKLQSTSQQQGTSFRLLFTLKRFNGTIFVDIPGVQALSTPVEVFSHTYYLKKAPKGLPPQENAESRPSISEALPGQGSRIGGERIAILGNNFINSPNLTVMFGPMKAVALFHESKTLIVTTPRMPPGQVLVRVSNDGNSFSDPNAVFTFL